MNSVKNKLSFDDLLKNLSFFGGVEFLNILFQITRSKFVAVLLGPAGIGLYGLYITSVGLISTLTNCGLDVSGVKFISSNKNNIKKFANISNLYKSLIKITAILGFITVIIFSPLLSYFTFQNFDHRFAFLLLSIYVFFTQMGHGNNTFLRGLRKQKSFAKSTLLSSLFTLVISVAFYYYFGINGIIPALVLSSISYFIVSQLVNFENNFSIRRFSIKNNLKDGKDILETGITYSFSGLLIITSSFLIQIFIKHFGSLIEVGLYLAAITIVNKYVNLIFKAMSIDFFPKLSEIESEIESNELVNQQSILSLLILSPIILLLIIFVKPLLYILYSSEFYSISLLVQLFTVGIFFRTMSWTIAYLFLSKGNTKLYFKNELLFNIHYLLINLFAYMFFGFNGLGFAFILCNFLYFIHIYISAKRIYSFKVNKDFIIILVCQIIFAIILICINYYSFLGDNINYIISLVIVISSFVISIKNLNSRSNILSNILNKLWKK